MIEQREQIKEARKLLYDAEAILITASNGLSITEGLHLFANNVAFKELLGDYEAKCGFHNLLHGFFYPWKSLEEKWGFYSRVIHHYTGTYTGSESMENLKKIVGNKPYFVVTSNAEGHFQLAGFQDENVYEVEGSWLNMRCSKGCHNMLYPTLDAISELSELEENGKVPFKSIPKCPRCGAVMELYDANPVEEKIARNWNNFLAEIKDKHFVVLELGIGSRNQLIKAPMMQLVKRELNASYISINLGDLYIPVEIADKSVGINGYIDDVLKELAK